MPRYAAHMGDTTSDEIARGLLFTTERERQAHAVAVESLLARNASMRTNAEVIDEALRKDPAFRAEWERTAVARAVATALVRYRADHRLTQRDLATRLGMGHKEFAELELGESRPSPATVMRIEAELGIAR